MKAIVLAGGADQIALIQELKKRNLEVVLVDFFENPPAKNFADKHIAASTLDVDRVRAIAITEKADLITTACTDQALFTVAKVSEELNLPCYITYATALNVTNKSFMKKVLRESIIPTAKYVILDSVCLEKLQEFSFPLVVKPVDCNSSKGVRKVSSKDELVLALRDAIGFSRTKTAIVEEFKQGEEISVDLYIARGRAQLLSVTNSTKIKNNNGAFTILQSCYPATAAEDDERILNIAQQIADAFQLVNTPLLLQMIVNKGEYNVLEFCARMGGGSKYKLIEILSGVNIMSTYVDLVLGACPVVQPSKKVNFAAMNYIYCNPGIFQSLGCFEELRQQGILDEYFQYKTAGMKITHAETSGDRPAGFLITAEDRDALCRKLRIADRELKIVDDKGRDIMKHGLYF